MCPKRNIIKRRGPRDVIALALVSIKVEGRTIKERERRDERETVNWMGREEG